MLQGEAQLSQSEVESIAEQVGTPFYVFHEDRFRQNLIQIRTAFTDRYDHVAVAYSFKTNYLPSACKTVLDLGMYAEVVSSLEFEIASVLGFPGHRIVRNGPVKTYKDVRDALDTGSLLNIETSEEVRHVIRFAEEKTGADIGVGLRMNFDPEEDGSRLKPGLTATGGRFGFDPDQLASSCEELRSAGVRIRGLHIHTSGGERSVQKFAAVTAALCETVRQLDLVNVEYVDIGGGFFGRVPESMMDRALPSFDDYADAVSRVLASDQWPRAKKPLLIIEPGVSVAADSLSLVTRVHSVKKLGSRNLVGVDATIYNVKPTMHSYRLPHLLIQDDERETLQAETYDIVGSTCMESDVLIAGAQLHGVRAGSLVRIDNVGAYTIVMTPPFINAPPPIVAFRHGEISCLRRPVDTAEFLAAYTL